MLRGYIRIAIVGASLLSASAVVHAQAAPQDSVAQDSKSKPAASSAPSTSSSKSSAAQPNDSPAPPDQKDSTSGDATAKPKKVWTNDDLTGLNHHTDLSVVGKRQAPQPNYNNNYHPPAGQTEQIVQYYRQQIDSLQQREQSIDKQISNLQDAKNGKSVDSERTYNPWGGVQGDWNAQIAQLQKQKDAIEQQIDQLEAAIRKLN